jgi:hypothetical protein
MIERQVFGRAGLPLLDRGLLTARNCSKTATVSIPK